MTMVPIPYRIYPASCNMNCSPRIHFIIPSLGLDRKLPLYLSITVPIAVATIQGEERSAMEKTRPVKPQKFLSAHSSQILPVTQNWNWGTTGYLQ